MTTLIANTTELIVRNTMERVNISVLDDSVDPPVLVNAFDGPKLTVLNLGETVLYKDKFPLFTLTGTIDVTAGIRTIIGTNTLFPQEVRPGDSLTFNGETHIVESVSNNTVLTLVTAPAATVTGASVTKPTRIVNPSTGRYYIEWGDPAAPQGAADTVTAGLFTFLWQATAPAQEQDSVVQNVCVATTKTLSFLPPFRNLIDKCRKAVDDTDCFLGYTDSQLIEYLDQGLSIINAYQPYPVFNTVDEFPRQFIHILLESSLIAGVLSQQLFAIDTDIPQFSDQGNTFVIQHAPQLASVLNQVSTRMDKLIPLMKYHFVSTGSLHIQAGNNFRLAQLIQAAPMGALFRNIFFSGS